MSYTTPFTAVAGTPWTAANWNTNGRDNIAWIATDSPACRVYNNANESIADSTVTSITFNSERFDNAAMHSTSSNTDRMTVPTGGAGKYLMGACLEYAANATGARVTEFYVNGSTSIVSQTVGSAGAGIATRLAVATVYSLSAADYLTVIAYQSSGGPLNVTSPGNNASPEAWCFWYRT